MIHVSSIDLYGIVERCSSETHGESAGVWGVGARGKTHTRGEGCSRENNWKLLGGFDQIWLGDLEGTPPEN